MVQRITCAVYKIKNNVNSKLYIGASALCGNAAMSVEHRWIEHKKAAQKGVNKVLYVAMREYGIENFTCEMIEALPDQTTMFRRERELIEELNTMYPYGYNKQRGRGTSKSKRVFY